MALIVSTAVEGHVSPGFEAVRDAFEENFTRRGEAGGACSAWVCGEKVVDIWGGVRDLATAAPWERDTMVVVHSATKGLAAMTLAIAHSRGWLDYDARVATYWPEFAQNGKQDIEIRHLLAHTSGVSGWDMPFDVDDVYDWEKSTNLLAEQAPWWEPGTASGYHAINYGHLIGEVIRRISGKTLKAFVRDEIAGPLEADVQIGARAEDDPRIAELIPPPPLDLPYDALPADHPMLKTFAAFRAAPDFAAIAETTAWRRADIGGANGHGNARALARALSPISLGGKANGVQLLSPATIDLIFEEQSNGVDQVLFTPLRFGIGFGLPTPQSVPAVPDGKICWWGGWGGSAIVMNPEHRATFAYVMNKMGPGTVGTDRTNRYARLFYEALA
jgi:CubicO group peptidase (beta-lactamase class C family)